MSAPQPGTPDAWLYEGQTSVVKHSKRHPELVERGFSETPLFYGRNTTTRDPKAQALADALRAIIHGSTANGLDSFRRPIASVLSQNIADAQDSLADWEGK